MTLDGSYRAVVDRIEDGVAVVLVEEDGEPIEELHSDPDALPADAGAGAVLSLAFDDGALESAIHRPAETERRRDELRSRFDALAERPPQRGNDGANDGGADSPSAESGSAKSGRADSGSADSGGRESADADGDGANGNDATGNDADGDGT